MRLYSAQQMRDVDARAAQLGVPPSHLMEAAGAAVAGALLERFPDTRLAVVLCGAGNNGGDGYVAAGHLLRRGLKVRLLELPAAAAHAEDDAASPAAAARRAFLDAGGRAEPLHEASAADALALLEQARAAAGARPVLVDALFGSGLNRPMAGWLTRLAAEAKALGARVVAVDVPSGLDADSAQPMGPHVSADLTVVLAGHKLAGLFYPARAAYGEAVLADIGVPTEALDAFGGPGLLDAAQVATYLPRRAPDVHKYGAGTVCVVAGSERYLGAAELACRGAWRGGAGLVTLVAPARPPGAWPETILEPHDWSEAGWPPAGLEPRHAGTCVIGPGLSAAATRHLKRMLGWAPGPVVLDAGALHPEALAAAGLPTTLPDTLATTLPDALPDTAPETVPVVLTPHAGEAARLLGEGSLVRRDPPAAAALLAQRYGATVVLKGPTTVIAEPGGRAALSTRGSPALASGGTGDVLAGLLGALLAAPGGRQAVFERACLAAWAHGVAGELAAAELGYGLVASDVAAKLPAALLQLGW